MKATVFFIDRGLGGKHRQATIDVARNEPNAILREAVERKRLRPVDYVTTIKCGPRDYQWYGRANEAFSGDEQYNVVAWQGAFLGL